MLSHPPASSPSAGAFNTGTVWSRPKEQLLQSWEKQTLLDQIRFGKAKRLSDTNRRGLYKLLEGMPVTGRVATDDISDPRWLAANPSREPLVSPGERVVVPLRPSSVTVIKEDGTQCILPLRAGADAIAYIRACDAKASADVAWIAQPDGKVERYKVAAWNREHQNPPAPGARIWAPNRGSGWPDNFSERFARFLATQVAAGQPIGFDAGPAPVPTRVQPAQIVKAPRPARDLAVTASDWGTAGLLQTPSARMNPAGEASISFSYVQPYARLNFMLQPLDWVEFGFRYTDVRNALYGSTALSGTQTYKDKSIDARFRLWSESAYIPQVAIGFRDVGGTGLFSSEYLVASKRTGDFDWSLGLGWGYLGARGDFGNPLSVLSDKASTRPDSRTKTAGGLSLKSMFRGRVGLFGGVQYQTPWSPLIIKAELDGNDYRSEPFGNNLPARWPVNLGIVYRFNKNLDFNAAFERGNRAMLGVTLHGQISQLHADKVNDPPRIPVRPRLSAAQRPATQAVSDAPAVAPQGRTADQWHATTQALQQQTGWNVGSIQQTGSTLQVVFDNPQAFYLKDRLDRAAAVLDRDAPDDIDQFVILETVAGNPVASYRIRRNTWQRSKTEWIAPRDRRPVIEPVEPISSKGIDRLPQVYAQPYKRFSIQFGPGYQQTLGGPNGFLLYKISADASAEFRLTRDTWISGVLSYRLIDNYNKFTYDAPSQLPRVRTYMREYMRTSRLTLPLLQATHVGKVGKNTYYSVYGGLLEPMFAGVGSEVLYRPWYSRFAVGVDVNAVRQRGFNQDFSLRDYRTVTGHITGYWDTGWNGVQANLSIGRYLARDIGATLDISRKFQNGVVIGAYATKTNISAEKFGEGSFDKGIYVSIPFDAMMTRSVHGSALLRWTPLTRDGGAKLYRANPLYDLTKDAGPDSFWYQPATGAP